MVRMAKKSLDDGQEASTPYPQKWDCEMTITGKIKEKEGEGRVQS